MVKLSILARSQKYKYFYWKLNIISWCLLSTLFRCCNNAERMVQKYRKTAKSTKSFCLVTAMSIVSWVPMTVATYTSLFCIDCGSRLKATLILAAVTIMMTLKVLNPWMYTMRNRDFRHTVQRCVMSRCRRTRVAPETDIYFTNFQSQNNWHQKTRWCIALHYILSLKEKSWTTSIDDHSIFSQFVQSWQKWQ